MSDTSELLRLCDEVERESFTDHEAVYWFTRATKLAYFLKSRLQAEAPTDAEVAKIEARQLAAEQPPRWDDDHANEPTVSRSAWEMACKDRRTLLAKLRTRPSQAEAQAPTTDAQASVLTDIGATVKVGSDGRWLCLQGIGQHAMLNLESLEVDSVHGPIVRKAINGFLKNLADRLTVGELAPVATTAASVLTEEEQILVDDFKEAQRKYPNSSLASKWHNGLLAIIDRLTFTVGAPAPAPTMPTRSQLYATISACWGNEEPTAAKITDAILALFAKSETP